MNLKSFIAPFLLFTAIASPVEAAELIDGGVYRFVNNACSKVMQAPDSPATLLMADRNNERLSQMWVVTATANSNADTKVYYVRNLQNGHYMTSPIQKEQDWSTTKTDAVNDETMSFIFDGATIRAYGHTIGNHETQAGYALCKEHNRVICYGPYAGDSQWTFENVEMDAATLNAHIENWTREPEPVESSIQPNRVYQFVNYNQNHAFYATNGAGNVNCATPDITDKSQLWVVEPDADNTGFYIRNLISGRYLQSPLATATYYTCSLYPAQNKTLFKIEPVSETQQDVFYIYPQSVNGDSYKYAHEDDLHRLFNWTDNNNNSKWRVNLVDAYTEDEIAAEKANWNLPAATIENGRVYRIINANYNKALVHNANNRPVGAVVNENDEGQLWIADVKEDGSGFILRNYQSGGALQSSMARSEAWNVVMSTKTNETNTLLSFEYKADGMALAPVSTKSFGANDQRRAYGYAHLDGYNNVVCWDSGSKPSQWTFTLIDSITAADVEAKRQTWNFTIQENLQGNLDMLFADKTCSELRPEYAAMTIDEIKATEAYQGLPEVLQQMVIKVHTGDWSETDSFNSEIEWDSDHAKKFRLQMYEPYSNCNSVASLTCIQAYTNFNNPTGIVTDNGTTLYVMVEKGPKEGATLTIAPRAGNGPYVDGLNNIYDGTQLKEGLNVVKCTQDVAEMVIYYAVDTNNGRTRRYRLDNYEDIKIHVEGGSINGFYNSVGDALYTPDTNEDWFYYRERARHPMFSLMSKYVVLYFHFLDFTEGGTTYRPCLKSLLNPETNFDLPTIMKAWDDLYRCELLIMGLLSDDDIQFEKDAGRDWYDKLEGDDIAPNDYHLYFNNRLMGVTARTGFMSATWFRTTYQIGTMRSILIDFPTMDLWGPAHEFGHLNQGPMKIAGTSEESNNVFSNVALFYRGRNTSRAELPSFHRNNFMNGSNFHQFGTWGTTRMWFQLWLYYHATGHNKKFYPRLYELLRDNPLRKNSTEHLNAKDDLLHFAKMCCVAAGEDLTDFFESYGFFVEQNGYYIGDYTSYTSYLSAEDIAEWKAEIAQMAAENGWKKNTAVIFIDDRVGSTKPGYADFCQPANAGPMGGLDDFINGNDAVTGNYGFTLNGTSVSISGGTGGVGFLIYDENGKLISFSNDPNFTVTPEVAMKLANGQASFKVVDSRNEEITVTDIARQGALDAKIALIEDLLERAPQLLAYADPTETKVGYLKPAVVAALQEAYDVVKAKYDAGEITEDNATELYELLSPEIVALSTYRPTNDDIINILPNNVYAFTCNEKKGTFAIKPNNDKVSYVSVLANINKNADFQQWHFIPADDAGSYYIRSATTNKYLRLPAENNVAVLLTDEPEQSWKVIAQTPRFVSVTANNAETSDNSLFVKDDNTIVRGNAGNIAAHWTLELIDDSESKGYILDLTDIIKRSESLLEQVGTIDTEITQEPVEISGDDLFTNAPCKVTTYGDEFTDATWGYLFDDNATTIFHSDYSSEGTSDGENHYIRISVPENLDLNEFILGYRTRGVKGGAQVCAPQDVTIEVSTDGEAWTEVKHITSGLSSSFATDVELGPFEIGADKKYIRMMVNRAEPNNITAGHCYFVVSELRLFKANTVFSNATPDEAFMFVTPEMMADLYIQLQQAKRVLANGGASNQERSEATAALTGKYDVVHAATLRNAQRLRELINNTLTVAAELGHNTEHITPISTQDEQYSSNALYTGENSGDRLTTWSVLYDGNTNTYFHSTYNANTSDGENHYIKIDMLAPTSEEETHLLLKYSTRNSASYTFVPVEAVVQYSADDAEWTTVQEHSSMLPTAHNATFETETFSVPQGTRYIRFMVNKSRKSAVDASRASSNGHDYFVVSEFVLSSYSVDSEPNTNTYPDANSADISAALREAHNAATVLNNGRATHVNYNAVYDKLEPYYQTLLQLKKNIIYPDSIFEISSADLDGKAIIYTLSGIRLKQISVPGVYIVNGKKVLVK